MSLKMNKSNPMVPFKFLSDGGAQVPERWKMEGTLTRQYGVFRLPDQRPTSHFYQQSSWEVMSLAERVTEARPEWDALG